MASRIYRQFRFRRRRPKDILLAVIRDAASITFILDSHTVSVAAGMMPR